DPHGTPLFAQRGFRAGQRDDVRAQPWVAAGDALIGSEDEDVPPQTDAQAQREVVVVDALVVEAEERGRAIRLAAGGVEGTTAWSVERPRGARARERVAGQHRETEGDAIHHPDVGPEAPAP